MGEIRENFILTDQFSAAFSRFLDMGNATAARLEDIGQKADHVEERKVQLLQPRQVWRRWEPRSFPN